MVVDIIEDEGRAPRQNARRNQDAPGRQSVEYLTRKRQNSGDSDAREHPDRERFVPQCQAEEEAADGKRAVAAFLIETDQRQSAADRQQVLEGNRPPIEADGKKVYGVRSQQRASDQAARSPAMRRSSRKKSQILAVPASSMGTRRVYESDAEIPHRWPVNRRS